MSSFLCGEQSNDILKKAQLYGLSSLSTPIEKDFLRIRTKF